MKIPFFNFDGMHQPIQTEILNEFKDCFDEGWFILGKGVTQFETDYASYSNVDYCIGLSNGLDALTLSLRALNIGKDDEVIVPSNTYIATVLAIIYVGAKPIFVEPNFETFNLDASKIKEKLTPRTKAIIPVHLFGQPVEMDEIMAISSEHSLFVIEDNAQSQGAIYKNKITGSFGHCNATSFYPGKNLGALGDAGAITTNSEQIAKRIKTLRNYGSSTKYYNEEIGYNMRLDELQARFLSVKLNHLNSWNQKRRELAQMYTDQLKDLENIQVPKVIESAQSVFHQYVIKSAERDLIEQKLNEKGIGTLIHYPIPPHLQEACADLGFKKGDFPIAEKIAKQSLSLPIYPGLTESQISYICDSIKTIVR